MATVAEVTELYHYILENFKEIYRETFSEDFYDRDISGGVPEGTIRVSNHWNFPKEPNDPEMQCPTHQEIPWNLQYLYVGIMRDGKYDLIKKYNRYSGLDIYEQLQVPKAYLYVPDKHMPSTKPLLLDTSDGYTSGYRRFIIVGFG